MKRWYTRIGASSDARAGAHRPARRRGPVDELGQRAAHARHPLALGQLARVRPGDDDVVGAAGQPLGLRPERLAQHALDARALDGAADLARHGQAEPRAGLALGRSSAARGNA